MRTVRFVLGFVLCFLLFPVIAMARPWDWGASVGSSIPNLRDNGGNDVSAGWSSRVAPYAGIHAQTPITTRLFLRAELAYVSQGGKRDGMQPIPDASAFGAPPGTTLYARFRNEAKLDYLELPLLLGTSFHEDRWFVLAGPYAGVLLSAHNVTSGTSAVFADAAGQQMVAPDQDFDATTDVHTDLHAWNAGIQAGVGAGAPLGAGSVTLDLRGELGLVNVQKDAANGRNSTGCLVVALGYRWRTGDPARASAR